MTTRTASAPQRSTQQGNTQQQTHQQRGPAAAPAPSSGYPAPWSNQARVEELGLQGGVDPHDAAAWELGGPFTPLLLGFATARAGARAAAAPPTVPDDPRALALALIEAALRGEAPPAPPAPVQGPGAAEAAAAPAASPTAAPVSVEAEAQQPTVTAQDAQTGGAASPAEQLLAEAVQFVEDAVLGEIARFAAPRPAPAAAVEAAPAPSLAEASPQNDVEQSAPALARGPAARPRLPPPVAPELEGAGPRGGAAPQSGAARSPERARLDRLLRADPMTVEQIAEARDLIKALPEAEQADAYLEVQRRSPYLNQRQNNNPQEQDDGGTCFPTAVAMALMSLGVPNPDPSRRYPDALMAMTTDNITAVATWMKVCARLGRTTAYLDGAEINKWTEAQWERRLNGLLGGGGAAVLSIGGHVVRVEGWKPGGMIVDDPYGQSLLRPNKSRGWTEKNSRSGPSAERGEGHDYPWAEVLAHHFNYLLEIR